MKLLLDTHVFLWFISGEERLPTAMREVIRDPQTEVFLSVVSLWEAIVKQQIGKLPLPEPAETYLPIQRERHFIESLSLDENAITHLAKLPSIHRDPFDRMLICQAIEHGMSLVTVDEVIPNYPVSIWR
ncbi:MAG: PIN domain nuclease [Anaerolineae bacterium CG03_land_8_20_14_0_80_58_20]|nr:MAG: twitching motility protein PilT [Anaerolineae bacterium CG1_02_58_13]PIV26189.1 MAG: PIN domain nuclease [Anaerolineae bacterium CG03_land_8_20_14_0_80_58_20]